MSSSSKRGWRRSRGVAGWATLLLRLWGISRLRVGRRGMLLLLLRRLLREIGRRRPPVRVRKAPDTCMMLYVIPSFHLMLPLVLGGGKRYYLSIQERGARRADWVNCHLHSTLEVVSRYDISQTLENCGLVCTDCHLLTSTSKPAWHYPPFDLFIRHFCRFKS